MSDTPGEARATQAEVKTDGGPSRAATRASGRSCWRARSPSRSTPVPEGVTPQSWRLLAIFAATIVGSIVRPIPGAAVVLLGVTATALLGRAPHRARARRLRRPGRVDGARGLHDLARDDQDGVGPPHRLPLHPRHRQPHARIGLRADPDGRAARDDHPLDGRALGRHHLPHREVSGRSLRLKAGRDGPPARRLPLPSALPVRGHHLRDVPDGAGVERHHRTVRERGGGRRADLRALGARGDCARRRLAARHPAAALPRQPARDQAHARRRAHRRRRAAAHGADVARREDDARWSSGWWRRCGWSARASRR